jgi:hypothetical protein
MGKGEALRAQSVKCQYTELDNKVMLDVLKMERANGNQSDSGWKSSVWTAVLNALKKDGSNKGAENLSPKAMFEKWVPLRVFSNFRWSGWCRMHYIFRVERL